MGNSNEYLGSNNHSLSYVIKLFHKENFRTKKTLLKTHLDNQLQENVHTFNYENGCSQQ